jgi:hypothetical protein
MSGRHQRSSPQRKHTQTHQEVIESSPTVATDRTQATTYDPYASRRSMSIKLTQAIYLIFGLIEAVLLIRFVLKALASSRLHR